MDKKQHLEDFFNNIPNRFDILEFGISKSVQKAYIRSSKKYVLKDNSENVLKTGNDLFDLSFSSAAKKRILINLAHLGSIEAYRIIEKYAQWEKDQVLREWSLLSLRECQMFLESDLTQEGKGFISTGLGGEGDRLRYYFVLSSKDGMPFSQRQKEMIEREFSVIGRKHNSLIEEIEFQENYSLVKALIPMDTAVGDVIEEGINHCNEVEDCIDFHYYVTNVRKPRKKEIREYLQERNYGHKEGEQEESR